MSDSPDRPLEESEAHNYIFAAASRALKVLTPHNSEDEWPSRIWKSKKHRGMSVQM